jgi:predicted PurR-regulated permease PerM
MLKELKRRSKVPRFDPSAVVSNGHAYQSRFYCGKLGTQLAALPRHRMTFGSSAVLNQWRNSGIRIGPKNEGYTAGEWARMAYPRAGAGLALGALTAFVFYLCYRLALPFVPALAWALVLAVTANSLHERILRRVRHPSVAAALSVLLVAAAVGVPAGLGARQIASETIASAQAVRDALADERWREALERRPRLARAAGWIEREIDVRAELDKASQAILKGMKDFVSETLRVSLGVLVTVFLLFYFFRDKQRMLAALRRFAPLASSEMDKVLVDVRDTIHAIVFGTLAVALVQGALGGLMFWWLSLPAPLLWGCVMALLAVLPIAGAALIWVPVAAFLALEGEWEKALVLSAWGSIVIALIDNLLYPLLVRSKLRLHTVPVFIALVGGLLVFGGTGVVLGPVVLALTIALLEVWRRRTADGGAMETLPAHRRQHAAR